MEALQRLHNRGSISTGYDIDNSVKLETANNEWLIRNSPTAGNRKTHTFSFWIKRTALGTINASGSQGIIGQGQHGRMFFGSDYFQYRFDDGHDVRDVTTIFRDTSAWYHIVVAVDTNQASSSNRVKIYFNGVQTTTIDHDGGSYPDIQDSASSWFNTNNITIGTLPFGASYTAGDGDYDMSGYLAEFAAVDGTQYAPTDFGEFDEDSGIWKPKDLSDITWGSEGYYLKFDDSSDLGADSSGNGNNFTLNNIAAADQATDTPTNNFATGNNLAVFSNPSTLVLTEGQTKIAKTANGWETLSSTIAVTSGKWYMEMQNISVPESAMMSVFPADIEFIGAGGQVNNYAGKVSGDGGISYYSYGGNIFYNATNTSYGVSWANETNTMAIALDMDNGKVYFARANVWQNSGDPTSGATGTGAINLIEPSEPHMMGYSIYANNTSGAVNFGGYTLSSISSAATDANGYGTFEYAPPSGYYALCTKNLEEFG
jgi:hypothetical protein